MNKQPLTFKTPKQALKALCDHFGQEYDGKADTRRSFNTSDKNVKISGSVIGKEFHFTIFTTKKGRPGEFFELGNIIYSDYTYHHQPQAAKLRDKFTHTSARNLINDDYATFVNEVISQFNPA